MNYEQCKALKDAGFDFSKCEYTNVVYLHELIEACGEEFLALSQGTRLKTGEQTWAAEGEDEPLEPIVVFGNTPEEAVAKLWLALNKK